jgi:hypothetical protein
MTQHHLLVLVLMATTTTVGVSHASPAVRPALPALSSRSAIHATLPSFARGIRLRSRVHATLATSIMELHLVHYVHPLARLALELQAHALLARRGGLYQAPTAFASRAHFN